ncbi:MAG: DEAD/DEAH box helicase [Chloroflexi bacterium]|nr:DEAD/DEAH box helicase [Chloroflexota bacterium]
MPTLRRTLSASEVIASGPPAGTQHRKRRRRNRSRRDSVTPSSSLQLPADEEATAQDAGTATPFGDIPISAQIARALAVMGYSEPTPIQEIVIPLVRQTLDVVGQAQTGTGKTAAFGIPLVESVDASTRTLQALVLTPTRELAVQVCGEINRLSLYRGVKAVAIYGGQAFGPQLEALHKGVQIVVATPGRLMDHMGRDNLRLDQVRMVVLDEADQMLDIGFAPDIERILRQTPRSRQTLLFSATMPEPIRRLANRYMRNPQWIRVGSEAKPVEQVEQVYYEVAERDKRKAIEELLEDPDSVTQALIFRRTKAGVDDLVYNLKRRRYDIQGIHGDMTQAQRDAVMKLFRANHLRLLVATNLAARGLDISGISHVINYDMPSNVEEYVHRIGRTARMGKPGTAITFVSEWDVQMFDAIQAHIGGALKAKRLAKLYAS